MSKRKSKIIIALFCAAAVISTITALLSLEVFAASDKKLTLICVTDDVALEGMKWKIYRVGEREGNEFSLTGNFAGYFVDLKELSSENISAAAQTLESYVVADRISPLASGEIQSDGKLTFSGLESGLYLALGSIVEAAPYYYQPLPLLVEVGDDASVSCNAYPKIGRATLTDEAGSYTVKKVWIDNDNSFEARPVNITVDIYRNGDFFKTVTLDESNNWQYSWECESKLFSWTVIERVIPTDYEVRIEYNETQYLIRNRHKSVSNWSGDEQTTTTNPTGAVETSSTTSAIVTTKGEVTGTDTSQTGLSTGLVTGSVSFSGNISTNTNKIITPTITSINNTSGGKLPQTGQLWWPVIPLAFGGTIMLAVGFMLKPKKEEK